MARILLDSRYATADIKIDENGVKYLDWFGDRKFEVSDFTDNVEHVVSSGDTVYSIASRYLEQQRHYWVICRANQIFNPLKKLVPGQKLLIPSIKSFRSRIIGQD